MAQQGSGDGLLRWLAGGLVAGAVVLGLLIAAYAVGYHRGQHHPHRAAVKPAPPATQPTTTRPAPTTTTKTPATSAQLVATGKKLFGVDGCSACHSLTGAAGAGPSLKGLAGSTVTLATGGSAKADDAYLTTAITDADAQIVKGYSAGIMSAAVKGFDLASKPDDVKALVAYIKAQK
jgi:mono/diheme cytochrome c family protein